MKVAVIIVLAFVLLPTSAFAEEVPNWFRTNANWFADDEISESDYLESLAFLIDKGVIVIESPLAPKSENNFPAWVKNNGEWWGEGSVPNDAFLEGINFLANNGIIGNNSPTEENHGISYEQAKSIFQSYIIEE